MNTPLPSSIVTIERHILEAERQHPGATGEFTNLLYDLALAAKVIANQTRRASLNQILGKAGEINIQGEEVMKLDVLADQTIRRLNDHTSRIAVMASEENPEIIPIPKEYPSGKYVLLYDPLDGSSNIDYNMGIGTIIAIYSRISKDGPGTVEDCLQIGRNLQAAVYIIYGTSTMLVYSTGHGVHGFTLDPEIGEFLLTHPNIQIPSKAKYYSVNQGYETRWSKGVKQYTRFLQETGKLSLRYSGSLIADFHRNLLAGGVFYYPADKEYPHGKLRLLYEAIPLAYLAEQAGGYASDGTQPILDIQPKELHQRTALYVGHKDLVKQAENFCGTDDCQVKQAV